MAKKAKKGKKAKKKTTSGTLLINSVGPIRKLLTARKTQASKVVAALKGGKKAKPPMKHSGPALAVAKKIEEQLGEAIQLMDDICGDNILSNPFPEES